MFGLVLLHSVGKPNLSVQQIDKVCGFESHPSNMPVMFFTAWESTEYTVLTHTSVYG